MLLSRGMPGESILPDGETWELRFGGRQGKKRTIEKFAILKKMHAIMAKDMDARCRQPGM